MGLKGAEGNGGCFEGLWSSWMGWEYPGAGWDMDELAQ